MKAYAVTLLVLDFDEVGEQGIRDVLENARYPNHCIGPDVQEVAEADIGEWTDEHPLNNSRLRPAEFRRLFGRPEREG